MFVYISPQYTGGMKWAANNIFINLGGPTTKKMRQVKKLNFLPVRVRNAAITLKFMKNIPINRSL